MPTDAAKIDLNGSPCPACGATGSTREWRTTWPEHGYPGRFVLRRCGGCGLLFNSPRLDGAALAALYGRNYYFFLRPPARELRRAAEMARRTVGVLSNEVEDRRSLDVGCGRGYLPAVLRGLGWAADGVEISPGAADDARRLFGLTVFTGTVEQYAASEGLSGEAKQYPLVTAVDVIEHVPDPAAFAAALAAVTAPGGLLVVDTPNADSYNINVKGLAWKGFNPFHIYLFNTTNLTLLLERHGFRVERRFSYSNVPLDESQPAGRRARDAAVGAARAAHLLRPAARAFFGAKKWLAKPPADVGPALAAAVGSVRGGLAFVDTPDAVAPLAEGERGDNLIVIARRV